MRICLKKRDFLGDLSQEDFLKQIRITDSISNAREVLKLFLEANPQMEILSIRKGVCSHYGHPFYIRITDSVLQTSALQIKRWKWNL